MLLTRDQIRQDKSFDLLTDAILERDQPRTADLFFRMVARHGRSMGDALSVVTAAEAPFVQVPSHINVRDGQITLVNNDHTILGLRTSMSLVPYVPQEYRLLPMLQSVWYIPAGLDIWNQLLGKYPGRYATMKGMNVPPPSYGPALWNQDQPPIMPEGSTDEKLQAHMVATISGDARQSYGLFLGLAADETIRQRLADHLLFLGLIDLQDTVVGRKARNTGHKALRARAVIELADFIGWERAHGVYYIGVPDMAIGPLYYSLYDAACVTVSADLPDAGKQLRQTNQTPLTPAEVEEMIQRLMTADGPSVWSQLTTHLRNGKSLTSLGDTIQIAAAELILRTTVPRNFTDGQHPFDYCNTANYWMRRTQSPYQARVLYLMANFVNDVARSNKLFTSLIEKECAGFSLDDRTPQSLLIELDEAILAYDVPRTTAIADAYLRSGADRKAYQATVAIAACKFQDDPHNQKITHSTFEEYAHNSTHLRDRLLLATVRLLAGWPKMPGERDCYARFMSDWINS
ncbi:MAG: hypothetical protein DME07_10765 [Candidatus Rokuibacteriota bacterium]|nr:MAG: hypothetical protein DME07_10765 [Candidatus Rokubacteria bacterium]PYN57133.1 MAG: hypothetical protein DMD94_04985 [Candidatus Rokubacteria bacterium]